MDAVFFSDPVGFLREARTELAREPVIATVVATVAQRAVAAMAGGTLADPQDWYAVVRGDDGSVQGVAMRTAPHHPRPVYLMPMPDPAARALARALLAREEEVPAATGSLPATRVFAEEVARATGTRAVEVASSRLFELGELAEPVPPAGSLRPAREDEAELCTAWFDAFTVEATGRRVPDGAAHADGVDPEDVHRRLDAGELWVWQDPHGRPVHLTVANPPAWGVARVGPVYTPPAERGQGYAAAAVAGVSRRLRDAGDRVCLFTDRADPTSNRLYEALGFRAVVDMGDYELR